MSVPRNFSWVTEGLLAAMAFPGDKDNLQYLVNQGVGYLVSLTAESTPPVEQVPELKWTQIKIHDFTPPTMDQVDQFMAVLKEAQSTKNAVGIHCAAGRGRTGTMVACYFVSYQNLSAKKAIEKIREMRPGSVETVEQEELIAEFERRIKQKK